MKDLTFGIIVVTFMVIFSVIEVLFLPRAFGLGVLVGMFLATTISITHRKLVKEK